jgi:hypothetical protein
MITEYYCKKCKESFHEEKLPNINKQHGCGAIARVIEHDPDEEGESE